MRAGRRRARSAVCSASFPREASRTPQTRREPPTPFALFSEQSEPQRGERGENSLSARNGERVRALKAGRLGTPTPCRSPLGQQSRSKEISLKWAGARPKRLGGADFVGSRETLT